MLKKLYIMQKLERKIKECDEISDAVGPMIKIVTAEKNKLMIQRLEIESALRKLGRDPKAVLEAAGLGKGPFSAPHRSALEGDEEEEYETLVMGSPGSLNTTQSSQNDEGAAAMYQEDLNLDTINPLDLLRKDKDTNQVEEEEDDDEEDEELEEWINNFDENRGVYIEEAQKDSDKEEEGQIELEGMMKKISVNQDNDE